MILTAHQPVYIPWLGLFHKIALADHFCVFDRVQYQTKDFNNRNKIKTQAGELWLSVPVESKEHFNKLLCDIKIVQGNWQRKQLKSIKLAYQKTPYFERYFDGIEEVLTRKQVFLSDLNHDFLIKMLSWLKIDCSISKASDFEFQGRKSDLVLDMCLQLNASSYIFGAQGKNYAEIDKFTKAGITPIFQNYVHPTYPQINGKFTPFMSAIDLLFNTGDDAKGILMNNNIKSIKVMNND